MMIMRFVALCLWALPLMGRPVSAQPYAGPFALHPGMQITTIFANEFGKDADSTTIVAAITPAVVSIDYNSTRGLVTRRDILISDRERARGYVLGYAPRMPRVIEGTTSLGISTAVLQDLRASGRTRIALVHSADLDRIECELTAVAIDTRVSVLIEDRVIAVPALEAMAECGKGNRTGTGKLIFSNDVSNPLLIESLLRFSWEKQPRMERVTRVAAGYGMQKDMLQSLQTVGYYEVYGLHFDFDSANLRPETAQLVGEIATMLKANANWIIRITGHTDSIGGTAYNARLSLERAQAIKQGLVRSGIAPERLEVAGAGETQPKADNSTMEGRAINRRVEFRRLDR